MRLSWQFRRAIASAGTWMATVCCMVGGVAGAEDAHAATAGQSLPLELVVDDGDELVRLSLDVTIDGQAVTALWTDEVMFAPLLSLYDRDGSGTLDADEATRLPTSFALRQSLWQPCVPHTARFAAWNELDANHDQRVTVAELAGYYRRAGLGQPLVARGILAASAAIGAALLTQIDTNQDGQTERAEWQQAERLLAKLDANGNELLDAGDLRPGTVYPGATGTTLLQAVRRGGKGAAESSPVSPKSERASVPVLVLPLFRGDTTWATELTARMDRDGDARLSAAESRLPAHLFAALDEDLDGLLSAAEVSAWRALPPDRICRVRLDDRQPELIVGSAAAGSLVNRDAENIAWRTGQLQVTLGASDGELPKRAAQAGARYEKLFAQADANHDQRVDAAELGQKFLGDLKLLLAIADRDRDEALSQEELRAWLAVEARLATAQVLVTILDHGPGLFELLDADHDGGLSARELRGAWEQLDGTGCLVEDVLLPARLPKSLSLSVSRGHAETPLPRVRHPGDRWFIAMDRNKDGDISRREFLGGRLAFVEADQDGDGLLNAAEGAAWSTRASALGQE